MKFNKFIILLTHYGFFLILGGILVIIIIEVHNHNTLKERITLLESVFEQIIELQINRQTELLVETGQAVGYEIASGVETAGNRINVTNERIQQMNTVYAGILAEMEKRTLDSLYTETTLISMEQEAKMLFGEGKFVQASVLYATVAEAQPENTEARFFYLYSLFLSNRLDRSNYRRIKEGFLLLERNGYRRREIRDVLEYIELEERGLEMEYIQ